MIRNFIITGTGGQGVLYASAILRRLMAVRFGTISGYDNRGGAQRLGHVCSVVRFDDSAARERLAIDFFDECCDYIIAMEAGEALRFAPKFSKRTVAVIDRYLIAPTNIRRSDGEYHRIEDIENYLGVVCGKLVSRDYRAEAAGRSGGAVSANLLMLGEAIGLSGWFGDPVALERALEPRDRDAFFAGYSKAGMKI